MYLEVEVSMMMMVSFCAAQSEKVCKVSGEEQNTHIMRSGGFLTHRVTAAPGGISD